MKITDYRTSIRFYSDVMTGLNMVIAAGEYKILPDRVCTDMLVIKDAVTGSRTGDILLKPALYLLVEGADYDFICPED